jgi:hypothetical protein
MPSTPEERKIIVPYESRMLYIDTYNDRRTVLVTQQDRMVHVKGKPTSADRVVYANEE